MARRKNKKLFKKIIYIIVAVIAAFSAYEFKEYESVPDVIPDSGEIQVHFIDVGQGSSTLIQSGEYGVLIDAGERDYGVTVCNYLNKYGIKRLSYVIATHPHSDHIGGMAKVLNGFKCDKLYAPELPDNLVPSTSCYEKLLDAISDNNIDAEYAKPGMSFSFGGALFQFMGPVTDINDLNNMSVVTKITYKDTSILITGDAEIQEMNTLTSLPYDFDSDIYAMSHHGSRTGLQKSFLKLVSPKIAVISCGKNNDYGHPHTEALNYLKNNKITYYRTDKHGDVVVTVNADGYSFETEK
ncbi:MAG: MBL fold metallo-hydrolase [Clostridia bacterium]|nr:MBL fold metallo-hydrolase [Clostridia bacterium]